MTQRAVPRIADLRHTRLCYRQDHYCGHPRQLPFRNYGNGEIVVGHYHAPSRKVSIRDIKTVFKEPNYAIRPCNHESEFVVTADCRAHISGTLVIPTYFPRLGPQTGKERCEGVLVSVCQGPKNKRQAGTYSEIF